MMDFDMSACRALALTPTLSRFRESAGEGVEHYRHNPTYIS